MCGVMMLPFYKEEILAYLDGAVEDIDLHPWQKGGALVDVYWRKSDGFMMARYFDYVDFSNGVEKLFNFVHENIYADVLDDFFGMTRAHRGSYVTEEYRKSDETDHKD